MIVLRRSQPGEGISGWLVGDDPDGPPTSWPYKVETLIADHNWDGRVWVGGVVRRVTDWTDGRPRFVCDPNAEPMTQ